jgi:hypothetical protein
MSIGSVGLAKKGMSLGKKDMDLGKGLKGVSPETVGLCLALISLDPNEGKLRPSLLKITRYAELRGIGETQAWAELRDGKIEAVKSGRTTLITYRSYLRRILELAEASGVPAFVGDLELYRAALKRVSEQGLASIETVAETASVEPVA